jgi:hypothetical protein
VTDRLLGGGTGGVIRVDPVTGAQTVISSGGFFVSPRGVAIDRNGDILVADISAFGGSGGVIRVNATTGAQSVVSSGGRFVDPEGIMVVPSPVPPVLVVAIDIKPGSLPNSINLGSAGSVPVAILSSADFDATQVDPTSITLSGASVKLVGKGDKYSCNPEDVNSDGLADLVCHVITDEFQLETGESVAVLKGQTLSGQQITGQDSVEIVP